MSITYLGRACGICGNNIVTTDTWSSENWCEWCGRLEADGNSTTASAEETRFVALMNKVVAGTNLTQPELREYIKLDAQMNLRQIRILRR